jgi:hypothetical protein
MAAKTWNEFTPTEKIEDIRRDVARLFEKLNWLTSDLQQVWKLANDDHSKLSKVAKAVEDLEAQRPKVGPKKAVVKKK